jgi:hypothetical protein
MNAMKSVLGAAALGILLQGLSAGPAGAVGGRVPPPPIAPKRLVEVPDAPPPAHRPGRSIDIEVRVAGGEGQIFYPGEEDHLSFRTARDAYVLVYGIDTEGRTRLLYPRNPWDPHFVRGQVTHTLPGRRAGYRLVADGPPGEEFVVGVASDRPLIDRWNDCWGGVAGVTEFERIGRNDYRVGLVRGDRFRAIERVSTLLVEVPTGHGRPGTARDYVSFFIGDPECRWTGGHGGHRHGPDCRHDDDDRWDNRRGDRRDRDDDRGRGDRRGRRG